MRETSLIRELKQLLGLDDFIRLAEAFGGTRQFVPARGDRTKLERALGQTVAEKLSQRYAGTYLQVPLAREDRARQYRERGAPISEIATRLGITERAVERLFARQADRPIKGCDPRQGSLFSLD